jgi:hypothetical protein
MEETLEKGKETYSPHLLLRLHYRMEICHRILQDLRDFLANLSPEMVPTWEKLVSLLRSTAALNTRSQVSVTSTMSFRSTDLHSLSKKTSTSFEAIFWRSKIL